MTERAPGPQIPPSAPEYRKTLAEKIEDAGELLEDTADDMENLPEERGWLGSVGHFLKSKVQWTKDIVNFAGLSWNEKSDVEDDAEYYDELIDKKKKEIRAADRKIRKASKNTTQKALAKENLARIDNAIENARNSGQDDLVEALLASREEAERELNGTVNVLEDEKNMLTRDLLRFSQEKINSFDNFITTVESKIEDIKQQDNYNENVENRNRLNEGIGKLSNLVSSAEVELINLRKALAVTKDREDKRTIKEAIKELRDVTNENIDKLNEYEATRDRLTNSINETVGRMDRFEKLKDDFTKRRNGYIAKKVGSGLKFGQGTSFPNTPPNTPPEGAPHPEYTPAHSPDVEPSPTPEVGGGSLPPPPPIERGPSLEGKTEREIGLEAIKVLWNELRQSNDKKSDLVVRHVLDKIKSYFGELMLKSFFDTPEKETLEAVSLVAGDILNHIDSRPDKAIIIDDAERKAIERLLSFEAKTAKINKKQTPSPLPPKPTPPNPPAPRPAKPAKPAKTTPSTIPPMPTPPIPGSTPEPEPTPEPEDNEPEDPEYQERFDRKKGEVVSLFNSITEKLTTNDKDKLPETFEELKDLRKKIKALIKDGDFSFDDDQIDGFRSIMRVIKNIEQDSEGKDAPVILFPNQMSIINNIKSTRAALNK
ncbi:MAG: hypothetical protein WCO09_03960 [bacterium]